MIFNAAYYLRLVVEWYVVHAEVGLQALEGAVGRVHGTAAAVAAQSHGVGDGRVHAGRTVGKLECLVVKVLVRAHMLVHVAERDLDDGVLEGSKDNEMLLTYTSSVVGWGHYSTWSHYTVIQRVMRTDSVF